MPTQCIVCRPDAASHWCSESQIENSSGNSPNTANSTKNGAMKRYGAQRRARCWRDIEEEDEEDEEEEAIAGAPRQRSRRARRSISTRASASACPMSLPWA